MKIIYLTFFIIISSMSLNSIAQVSPLWQVSFNDSLPEDNFAVKSKIDNEDNIVILARGSNSSLGTGVDFILIKYNGKGEKLWNRRFNGTGNSSDYPADMVIDKYNNIYVTGRSWGGSSTKNDYLTLKYSPSGELMWSRRFDWLVSRNDEAYAMALDSNENVYVTGFASYDYSNGHEISEMLTVKYNSLGEQIWVRGFQGLSDQIDWGYTVVCDSKNNIIVSGFTYSINLNFTDIISIKYNSSGNVLWEKRFYNHGDDFIRPLFSRIDVNDNIIIASYYKGDSTLMDYLTFKYDSTGTFLWSRTYDGGIQLNDWVNDIKIDYKNNIIVTGSSPGLGTSYDFLTIKYSPEGNMLWQNRYNDSTNTNDEGTTVAVDSKENVLVFGTVNSEYSVVCYYNENGKLISNFRNHSMKNAASINIDKNDFPVIVGLRDPKTITAKYLDIITNVLSSNSSYPDKYILQQNYPNPFNPFTNLEYVILNRGFVILKVYNSLGKLINTLVNEDKIQGTYKVKFDGSNLPSGIYFYSLFINDNLIETKRMILLK
ncbi:MAG: SBBP repeat-containing protein [Ignavibacteria bacterium]|jgi:hypothetical protein|nr:SBBP repeat-containing protein [Ignavibacteria bacterium]